MEEQARFCGSCGKALTEGRPFCGFCGAANTVTATSPNSAEQMLPAARGSRKTLIWVGVIVVLALVTGGVYLVTARHPVVTATNPAETTSKNSPTSPAHSDTGVGTPTETTRTLHGYQIKTLAKKRGRSVLYLDQIESADDQAQRINRWLALASGWNTSDDDSSDEGDFSSTSLYVLSDDFVTIRHEDFLMGGVHPLTIVKKIHYLIREKRALTFEDLFNDIKWRSVIGSYVYQDLKHQLGESLQLEDSPDEISKAVADISDWSIEPSGLRIEFEDYAVAPHGAGRPSVKIPLSLIRPLLSGFAISQIESAKPLWGSRP